jgi:hypothetical protein
MREIFSLVKEIFSLVHEIFSLDDEIPDIKDHILGLVRVSFEVPSLAIVAVHGVRKRIFGFCGSSSKKPRMRSLSSRLQT